MSNLPIERSIAATVLALASWTLSAGDWRDKVDVAVWTQAAKSAAPIDVLITPTTPAKAAVDVLALSERTAPAERPRVIHAALQSVADASQRDVLAWLAREGIAHRRFVVVNAIAATMPPDKLSALAKRADRCRASIPDPLIRRCRPKTEPMLFGKAITALEPGVSYINADDVWALPGNPRGAGVVIAGQDTGYRWTHPAIKANYLGWNGITADHNYAWHDAIPRRRAQTCGANSLAPCDDSQHGTHTMGTMVGDNGSNRIVGVAPDAKWIGCRNMEEGNGTPTPTWNASTGSSPQPISPARIPTRRKRRTSSTIPGAVRPPRVATQARHRDQCDTAVANLTAAGVLVVASAGNSGSACSTVNDPPAMFSESFSVGAWQQRPAPTIASFSSRGPVTEDGRNRMKPDIAAPGVGVRSSRLAGIPRTAMSGTSMAGPHVAGSAALLMSADPHRDAIRWW
ncbi:MAG: S8 family serine peptidase [Xanthomonadales bacterium]|nr:S8 family serine peptidase [Xanthomonadales bacterium]